MKIKKYQVKIVKHNRVWTIVEVSDGNRVRSVRAKKESLEQYEAGKTVYLNGYLDFGQNTEFVIVTADEARAFEIERWIGYFRRNLSQYGTIYERGIKELQDRKSVV